MTWTVSDRWQRGLGASVGTTAFLYFNLNEKIQEVTPGYGHQSLVPTFYEHEPVDIKLKCLVVFRLVGHITQPHQILFEGIFVRFAAIEGLERRES